MAYYRRGKSWRVVVYAGRDPLTGKKCQLTDTVPTWEAAKVREAELILEASRGMPSATRAKSMGELVDRWYEWRLTLHDEDGLSPGTAYNYRNDIEHFIKPAMGKLPVERVDVALLDRFYAQLRKRGGRCRRCAARLRKGMPAMRAGHTYKLRPRGEELIHETDCASGRPLAASTVRQVHAIISGALQQAVVWGWISYNPARLASPPSVRKGRKARAIPPEAAQALQILEAARTADPELEVFLRLASVLGSRRGELCSLRWPDIDFDHAEILVDSGVIQVPGQPLIDQNTKNDDDGRRLAVDTVTLDLLRAHQARITAAATDDKVTLRPDAYVFASSLDGSTPRRPDSFSHRFAALRDQLGLKCRLHDLRHFMITQLMAAGVDVATVAGRVGHRDGGVTTLKVYAHALRARDQHAAKLMGGLLEQAPGEMPATRQEAAGPEDGDLVEDNRATTAPSAGEPTPDVPSAPSGRGIRVQRRVNPNGRVMVARQQLRIGKAHAGKSVTIVFENERFRAVHGDQELPVHPCNPTPRQPVEPVSRPSS